MNRLRSLLIALTGALAATAALAGGSPAGAAASTAVRATTSSNWAGYAATGWRYRKVQASWVQPAADCSASPASYSAFWVGLGGYSRTSQALEQVGTEADCSASGAVVYRAWYELVPADPVAIHVTVRPGDRITGSVTVSGRSVLVRLADVTRGTSVARRLRMSAPDVTSAEWIAEAPSACVGAGGCAALPLADFGQVGFSGARATTATGHTGTIADAAWQTTAITLHDERSALRGPRAAASLSASAATPSALAASGSAFMVTWSQTQAQSGGPGALGSGAGGLPAGSQSAG